MASKDILSEIEYHKSVPELREPVQPTTEDKFREYAEAPARAWKPLHRFLGFIHEERPETVLELGCGAGQLTTRLAKAGYRVTALELSPELIAATEERAALDGVASSVEAIECDLQDFDPGGARYDLVAAKLVLHHVDLDEALDLVVSALKPEGAVVIWEPVAFSRCLQRLRDLVPVAKDVSPNERQLDRSDLDKIASRFEEVEECCFYLFARVRRLMPQRPWARPLVDWIEKMDAALLRRCPALTKFAGTVVIRARRPLAGATNRAE
jgi:SAM-dependent methyltransferase